MADREKVIRALENCTDEIKCRDCQWETCETFCLSVKLPLDLAKAALSLLKAQGDVIDALLKVGYPHNFQKEPRWIVNYMYAITDVIKKAVNLRNEVPTIPEEKV